MFLYPSYSEPLESQMANSAFLSPAIIAAYILFVILSYIYLAFTQNKYIKPHVDIFSN